MLENKAEYDKMAEVEAAHWWYNALHKQVFSVIHNHFHRQKNIEILDAGCGTGGLLLFLKNRGFSNLQGFDVSEYAMEHCKASGLNVFRASLINTGDFFLPGTMDVIVCCDALYFLDFEQQKNVLAAFYSILKPGGVIILNLPALEAFRGIHDLSVGIKQRYHHRMLQALLPPQALNPGYFFYYWPVLLSPLVAIARAWQRVKMKVADFEIKSDAGIPGVLVNRLLTMLMRAEFNLRIPVNFGSSLFVVIQK